MQISLTGIQVIDLFFRFAATGQLVLLVMFLLRSNKTIPVPQISMITCIIGYVLLTAPIEDNNYGGFRHVLLLLTDLTPFITLWFTASQLNRNFRLFNVSKWITLPISFWCLGLVYLFLVLGGKSILHDLNHGIGIGVLVLVIYVCVAEYFDDLDNRRRNTRLLVVAFCSFYMTGLVSFEFVLKSVRDSWQFSFINALVMFSIILLVSVNLMQRLRKSDTSVDSEEQPKDINCNKELLKLSQLMNEGAYQQQELTVGKLAEQVHLPQHQLRQLINQELGFSNFSHYLNSYRVPWVCKQLQEPNKKHIPILTLALEAGYGSIAPFNRAFKKHMGTTPKQYRDQF